MSRSRRHSAGSEQRAGSEESELIGPAGTRGSIPFRSGWSAYVVRLLLWCLLLGAGYTYLTVQNRPLVGSVSRFSASACALLVSCAPGTTVVEGNRILHDGHSVVIIDECLGGLEAVMLVSAILAVTVPVRRRVTGIVGGVAVIYLFNLLRIAALAVAGSHSESLFRFFHIYLGQASTVLLIVVIWLVWLRYASR